MLNEMRQYLSALTIDTEQKRYAMNFCKKIQYLEELRHIAVQDTGEHICTGYGNVNSRICLVFENKEKYDLIKSIIATTLEKFQLNPWNVYITFVDKTKSEYDKKYSFLINEIHAIGADLMLIFDTDERLYDEITNAFNVRNISLPEKHFFIDVNKLASIEQEDRKVLWNAFKYLINYKEIEQEE